jgi:hypothetical protein
VQSRGFHCGDIGDQTEPWKSSMSWRALLAADHRFVMRVTNWYATNRDGTRGRLGDLLSAGHISERRVFLNRRPRIAWEPQRKIHPPREARETTLFFAAEQVVFTRVQLTNPRVRLGRSACATIGVQGRRTNRVREAPSRHRRAMLLPIDRAV